MKIVIFGSRDFKDYPYLKQKMEEILIKHGWEITSVLCGDAQGADALGDRWAKSQKIPVEHFPAKWDDLDTPGAIIKTNKFGKEYNAKAGHDRNKLMGEEADAGVGFSKNGSSGTSDMHNLLEKLGKTSILFDVTDYDFNF